MKVIIGNIPYAKYDKSMFLSFLKQELIKEKNDDVRLEGDIVVFKNKIFNKQSGNSRFAFVLAGKISLNSPKLVAEYTTPRFLLIFFFSCLILGLYWKTILVASFVFLWIYAGNYVLTYYRQRKFLRNAVKKFDSSISSSGM